MHDIRLWVDSNPAPPGWLAAHSAVTAKNIISRSCHHHTVQPRIPVPRVYRLREISLDYHLGSLESAIFNAEDTGYYVALFLSRLAWTGDIEPVIWSVHCKDPNFNRKIVSVLRRADVAWRGRYNWDELAL